MAEDSNEGGLYRIAKIVIGATWLFAVACFFPPLATKEIGSLGQSLFWVLAVVHAVECVLFLNVVKRSRRPLAGELWQTFLFGIVHVSLLRRELAEDADSP
ncbi:MAG: hypothetical protein CL908_11945 [Deltaproteobacteria bacterium]|nr:hypothetical protein [Deltaproteobacteria bacterium]